MALPLKSPHVPSFIPFFNPIARRLLKAGIPMGPNALVTVRGRKSGRARTTPVALIEVSGRRWVIGTFGEVNWVRNLRTAGEATLTVRRRTENVTAVELTPAEGVAFVHDVLGPYVGRHRLGRWMVRRIAKSLLGRADILDDPVAAAQGRPVFELLAAGTGGKK
jgi:deazaflavin-dependent oxidoreductase (nitroreductase family)